MVICKHIIICYYLRIIFFCDFICIIPHALNSRWFFQLPHLLCNSIFNSVSFHGIDFREEGWLMTCKRTKTYKSNHSWASKESTAMILWFYDASYLPFLFVICAGFAWISDKHSMEVTRVSDKTRLDSWSCLAKLQTAAVEASLLRGSHLWASNPRCIESIPFVEIRRLAPSGIVQNGLGSGLCPIAVTYCM